MLKKTADYLFVRVIGTAAGLELYFGARAVYDAHDQYKRKEITETVYKKITGQYVKRSCSRWVFTVIGVFVESKITENASYMQVNQAPLLGAALGFMVGDYLGKAVSIYAHP